MKAIKLIYLVVLLYFVYYACCMAYRVLGDDSIPLFVSGGILFVLRWIGNIIVLKDLDK